jgi:tetratricopeptide (TPR) repeat protein
MARRRLRSSGRDVEQTLMLGSAQGPEFHGAPLQAAAAACGWSPLDEPLARSDDPLGITRVTAHPLLCHSVEFRRHVYFEVCEDRLERHPLGQRARLAVATALADIVDGASWGDLEGADQLAVGTRLLELLDDVAIDEQRAHRYRRTLPLHLGARRLAMGDPQGAAELIQPLLGHRDVPQHDRIAARRLLVKAAYTQGNPQLEASLLRDWATEESREHHLLTCQADFAARHGRASEAVARCREAVALLAHDDPRLVQTSTSLAQALWSAGQSHQALAQLTENEREHGQAEQMGGDVATARHHVAALASHDLERNLRVLRLTSEVISAYEHNGDREAEIISRVNLGDAQLAVGQGNAGLVTARQAYEQARESGLPQAHDIAAICLANALALKGEYNNALELYDEGIELAESIGHRWDALYGLAYQALCRAEAGQQLPERALWKLADQATDEGYAYLGSLAITHALLVARRSGSGQLAAALTEAGRRESDSTAVSTRVYAAALQLVEGIAVPSRARVAAFLRLVGRCEGIKGRPEVILEALDRPALVRQLTAIEDEFARRWRARFHLRWEPEPDEVTLRACDYRTCEARCCYDGVYLQDDDVRRIQQAIRTHPEAFPQLPPEPIVHGTWEGRGGLKTAVRAHQYQSPDFPEHFTASRCVFAAEDGACSLQVLGVRTGEGPWHYKPRACWAHPLHLDGNDVVAPPLPGQQDRDDLGLAYPGYTNHTPCGQHRSNGEPWDIVLADETDCLHRGNAG